jgi:L-alanine-DL-glutamate epimerase-like enolase superfamily enzyme
LIISQIYIYTLDIPFHKPLKVAIGTIDSAQNIAIKITTKSGLIGWGEASPYAYITGDCQATNYQTAQQLGEKRGQMNVCLVCHPGRGSWILSRFPICSLSEPGAFSRPIT